jgi:hypothetical protein
MKIYRSRVLLLLVGLLVVGLPLAGRWARNRPNPGCEFDGLELSPLYQVRIVDRAGASHFFCSVRCASLWLERQVEQPAAVYVTDETSGVQVDARSAYFVRSTAVTDPITGNRVHVFQDRAAALQHVRAFGGQVLGGLEQPFKQEVDASRPRHE